MVNADSEVADVEDDGDVDTEMEGNFFANAPAETADEERHATPIKDEDDDQRRNKRRNRQSQQEQRARLIDLMA
jgi:hypothetical protein